MLWNYIIPERLYKFIKEQSKNKTTYLPSYNYYDIFIGDVIAIYIKGKGYIGSAIVAEKCQKNDINVYTDPNLNRNSVKVIFREFFTYVSIDTFIDTIKSSETGFKSSKSYASKFLNGHITFIKVGNYHNIIDIMEKKDDDNIINLDVEAKVSVKPKKVYKKKRLLKKPDIHGYIPIMICPCDDLLNNITPKNIKAHKKCNRCDFTNNNHIDIYSYLDNATVDDEFEEQEKALDAYQTASKFSVDKSTHIFLVDDDDIYQDCIMVIFPSSQ